MNSSAKKTSTVIVTQLGARRHYAVPLALQRLNMLERFFTDIYFKTGIIRKIPQFLPGLIKALESRNAPGLRDELVTSFLFFGLAYTKHGRQKKNITALADHWQKGGAEFCNLVLKAGIDNADAVYAYSSAALETFKIAKEKGITCILDHATAPLRQEKDLVDCYREAFPGWFYEEEDGPEIDKYTERQRHEADLADVILCGSTFIKNMLVDSGVDSSKIHIVPLGIKENFHFSYKRDNESELHVLFAGNDGLRKGIGYLCLALNNNDKTIIKAAGNPGLTDKGLRAVTERIELIGTVPHKTMLDLYDWADVFILPSISETFGLVILEAMSRGVPVITTPNTCGPDVIADGQDGFIIPVADSRALSEKLECLASDAKLLQEISEKAYIKSKDYSLEKYGERLSSIIKRV